MQLYRRCILFLILTGYGTFVNAQRIRSSCNAPDTVRIQYANDADRLALRRVYTEASHYMDSANIPASWSDSLLDALMAVHNVDSIPAADTVIRMFKIHTLPQPVLNSFYLAADSNLYWMQQIHKNVFPTGVDSFDMLIKRHQLKVARYYPLPAFNYHIVVFESDRNYNFEVISNHFDSLSGVYYANRYAVAGDGDNIQAVVDSTFTDLEYAHGWGDCPSGCMQRRYWKFRVFHDCSVLFLGSYGNLLSTNSANRFKHKSLAVYPNPFTSHLLVPGMDHPFEFAMYNVYGQPVHKGHSDGRIIENLSEIPPGMYVLEIRGAAYISRMQVLKQ